MLWTEETFVEALRNGATFIDPDGVLDGYILFYEGEIRDGTLEIAGKRLFGYFTDGKNVTPIASDVIWDLAESKVTTPQCVEVEDLKNLVFTRLSKIFSTTSRNFWQSGTGRLRSKRNTVRSLLSILSINSKRNSSP